MTVMQAASNCPLPMPIHTLEHLFPSEGAPANLLRLNGAPPGAAHFPKVRRLPERTSLLSGEEWPQGRGRCPPCVPVKYFAAPDDRLPLSHMHLCSSSISMHKFSWHLLAVR